MFAFALAALAVACFSGHSKSLRYDVVSLEDTSLAALAVRLPAADTANARTVLSHDAAVWPRASARMSTRRVLLDAEDRAMMLQHGLMLPTFLRRPPPVIVKQVLRRDSIRVLAFGDWGFRNTTDERKVATAVRAHHTQHPFDFGITLGDNFYVAGMPSPDDPRLATEYEPLYKGCLTSTSTA